MTTRARWSAGLFAVSATLVIGSFGAMAADAPPGAPAQPPSTPPTASTPATTPPADARKVEKVTVTGSRIRRPNLEQPTPVTTIDNARIRESGTSNLGDIVAQLPALDSSGTVRGNSNSFADSGGLNFPNLRGLGTQRTLTLVNGKRHVAGDAGVQAVDFNSIPTALVDRVEVVTGGTSAIYGSDAVTGVLNIILKDDFEGYQVDAQASAPTGGNYGRSYSMAGTYGSNFNQEKGNLAVSLFHDRNDAVDALDISALDNFGTIRTGVPGQRRIVSNVVSEFIDENSVLIPVDHTLFGGGSSVLYGFNADGSFVHQPTRLANNSLLFGQLPGCATCFKTEDWTLIIPDTNRTGGAINFRYQITPNLRFKTDAKYVTTDIRDFVQPSFSFADNFIDLTENPFTPAGLLADFTTNGLTPVAGIARFNADIGARESLINRATKRIVASFDGTFDAGNVAELEWEVSFNRGITKNKIVSNNTLLPGNYAAAIDAVLDPGDSTIKCRKDVPSAQPVGYVDPSVTSAPCIPYNPFGQQNSAAAIAYVSIDGLLRRHTISQDDFQAVFTTDTGKFLNLPGGPIGLAGGFEYRKEQSENINDGIVQSGITEIAPQADAVGGYNVKEGFLELSAPILEDVDFAHRLTLDAAYRYADYSHAGVARSWKVGGIYAPVQDFSLRSTYARAVRAPNITEAFLPPTSSFFGYSDPCDAARLVQDPDRAANCAALGIPQPFSANDNISVPGVVTGNTGLTSETADTFTVGAIVQPRWVKNFSVTVDYYKIDIANAISQIDVQDALDNCVDSSAGLDPAFCSLVTRDPTTHQVTFLTSTFVNASALNTRGWDIQLNYGFDVDDLVDDIGGRAGLSLTANRTDKLRLFPFQSNPNDQTIGEGLPGTPRWSFTTNSTYDNGPWHVTWRGRFEGEVRRSLTLQIIPPFVEPVWYHDFYLSYGVQDLLGYNGEVFAGVNNAFDEQLPLNLTGNDASYDIVGRTVFTGVRAKF